MEVAPIQTIEVKDETHETKEQLRQDLIDRKHSGMIWQFWNWLKSSVPNQYKDGEELEQQVLFYYVDAIEKFDPTKGTKFTSFLSCHLKMKCVDYQQYLWIRSVAARNRKMLPMRTAVSTRLISNSGRQWKGLAGGDHFCQEPISEQVHVKPFETRGDLATETIAVDELLGALSEAARHYIQRLFEFPDQDMLVAAFASAHFRSKVSKITGLTKQQVIDLSLEISEKLPNFLEV